MKTINTQRLQNAEHLSLMSDLLALMKEANVEGLSTLKTQLQTGVEQSEAAQTQIKTSEHTASLVALDEKRDRLYRGLTLRVQSETFSPVEERKKAAEKVSLVIETYGNFTAHNYQKETAEIQNFIADLKGSDYLPSVQKIGLEQWVSWLETANNDFHAQYTQRRDEYAGKTSYDLKNIRKDLDEVFRKITDTASALAILQPSEALTTFINKANASIDKWKEILAQRKGRKEKKNEGGEPTVGK